MRYFGGKARIGKGIADYLTSIRKDDQPYIEPFVGGGWIMYRMDGERYGFDKHPYLIDMYQELQKGWIPPTELSEDEYNYIKENKDELSHLTGFVGFGCSFAGKWFGGYARSKGRNYCLNAHNSIMKKMDNMNGVQFECKDYRELSPEGALIYCDPPYQGTTQYGDIVGDFDTGEFWDKVREWSKDNTVVVSEYSAPDDFVEVWRRETKTDMRNSDNRQEQRVEKLFVHELSID